MVTTSSNTYWAPLKPRIRIYALTDSSYTTPIFSYDGFTGVSGSDDKVLALNFETAISNVGQCSITIEDSNHDLDVNDFVKGQRVFIEGSKDNSTWQPAFKGLVRGAAQEAIGETGRNLTITAYNLLIRLNERIIKINKESSKTGSVYDQTDSTMFTDNLINDIMLNENNYVYAPDEAANFIIRCSNIGSSPVTTWVPKLDVEYNTLQSALDEILDYSGGLFYIDFSNDEVVLHEPDQITSSANVFRVTNVVNKNADDVLNTMYPLEPYTYSINYDTDESASRLILPFKHPDSSPRIDIVEPTNEEITGTHDGTPLWLYVGNLHNRGFAFRAPKTGRLGLIRIVVATLGNCSGFATNSSVLQMYNRNNTTGELVPGVIDQVTLYVNSTPGTSYPSSATSFLVLGMSENDFTSEYLMGEEYWIILRNMSSQSNTQTIGWVCEAVEPCNVTYSNGEPPVFTPQTIGHWPRNFTVDPGVDEINLDWIVTATDRAAQKRLGSVERTVSSIPRHIDGLQTIQQYLYPRINTASKPRFNFDYPSLTMPNRIPKAGDILCHFDTTVDVGTETTPVQTSVITSARYDFGQDSDGVLGLRKLGLSTAGLRRGHY